MDGTFGLRDGETCARCGSRRTQRLLRWLALGATSCLGAATVAAAAPDKGSNGPPHASVTGVSSELAPFRVRPGFKLELVASEPMVTAPVALAFDENGRLFVAENPVPGSGGPALGRIRLLEGIDNDGGASSAVVYAEGVPRPSAIACYGGGVFVASSPELLFLKAAHGEGAVDVRQVVLTGFGATNSSAPSQFLNNFNWGLDNHIHGATAGLGGRVAAPNWSNNAVELAGCDVCFDPRTLEVFPEAGPAGSGLTFDNAGRRFICDFERPLRLALFERRYFLRNPYFPRAAELVNVLSPATPVFTFATGTAAERAGLSTKPPSSGSGSNALAAGWLTHAQGVVIYRGNAFPSNYVGNVFLADPEAHAIHREVLRDNGLGVQAERPADEQKTEFLLSTDPLFHPVQVVNGPDGALYIADRRDGREQGRIYRVVPVNFKRPAPPGMSLAKSYDLVASLASNNGWRRDTAARLLFERQDPAATLLLSNMVSNSRVPLARVHALHALAGLGGLREAHLLLALRDADPTVREHGVLLAEGLAANGRVSDALWQQLKPLAADPALRVRYQLAMTLGEIQRPDKAQVLAQILSRDFSNPWIQSAVLSSLADGAGNLFVLLASNASIRNNPAGIAFLRQLATMIGLKGRQDETAQAVGFLSKASLEPFSTYALLNSLGDGLQRTRSSLALADPRGSLAPVYTAALSCSIDPALLTVVRTEAVHLLGLSSYAFADVGDWLLLLCNPPPVPGLQSAALSALGTFEDPGVFTGLVRGWPALTPGLRTEAIAALLSRTSRVGAVLEAIEKGIIPVANASQAQLNFLRTYRDPAIRQRALKLFGPVVVDRPQVLEQFKPALRLTGAAEHGRTIFAARCATCHQSGVGGEGIGPDLMGVKTRSKDQLLALVIEPNAHLKPEYAACVVQTRMSENVVGLVVDDNPAGLTLQQPGLGKAVWPRLNVASADRQNWSFMPVGLEQGLSAQDMADLLAYLMTAAR